MFNMRFLAYFEVIEQRFNSLQRFNSNSKIKQQNIEPLNPLNITITNLNDRTFTRNELENFIELQW